MPINPSPSKPDPLFGFLPRLYLPLLMAFIAVATWRPLTGAEDFYAHAAIGRWIWQHQSVPHHTLWLWSTPPIEWIAHSWLTQLTLFALESFGGEHLVLAVTILLAGAPFVWMWRLWEKRGRVNAFTPLYFMLAIWCACVRFQSRPELFTSFFLGILLLFLIQWPQSMTRRNIIGIALMFVLWANFHGAVALGLLVLCLTAVCELLQQKLARSSWMLGALAVICLAAVNFNPYGFSYWQALRPVGGAMFQMIDEWKSPLVAPALPFEALMLVVFVTAIAFIAWVKNPERRWAQAVWLFLALVLFFMARRNLWPCILLSVAVAAANANVRGTFDGLLLPARTAVLARTATVTALLTALFTVLSPVAFSVSRGIPHLRATSPLLPQGAADTVLQRRLPQPVFNDYLRSGYLHWRFAGQPPIYIDLLNAYPDELLANYFDIIKRTPKGIAEWEALKVNTVVFGSYKPNDRLAPLAKYLDRSPQWQKLYEKPNGAVWVRKSAWQVQF